jgi:hypothetical protein
VEALLRGPIRDVGKYGSDVAKSMHSLDRDVDVRDEFPCDTEESGQIIRRERGDRPMVNVYPVGSRPERFVPV